MHRSKHVLIALVILIAAGLAACRPQPQATATPTKTPEGPVDTGGQPVLPTETPIPTPETVSGEPTLPGPFGPTGFPPDVNPLTGLVVSDPAVLDRRPILIKVSNESQAVRPQSGLSFADHVWEYQMEGFAQTRYTAVMYGQSAERVGSVRSARLIDIEHLVPMYGAVLSFSGGSSKLHDPQGPPRIVELTRAQPWANRVVCPEYIGLGPLMEPYLVRIPDIPRPGTATWHTLFAIPDEIWRWAETNGFKQRPNLDGLKFDYAVPPSGTPTDEAIIDYPGYGPKHTWRYDPASGRWLSWTEHGNTAPEETPDGDTLRPDEQLAFDNVVIIYAVHYEADFIEDEPNQLYSVGINLTGEGQAVLMRDGQRYEVTWRRVNVEGMLQFFDATGAPIAFKPGTTWFNVSAIYYPAPQVTFSP